VVNLQKHLLCCDGFDLTDAFAPSILTARVPPTPSVGRRSGIVRVGCAATRFWLYDGFTANVCVCYFLDYYRKRGVDHFFFVDNDGDDGSRDMAEQDDVPIWLTKCSYAKATIVVRSS
jgi:hypothetical protein